MTWYSDTDYRVSSTGMKRKILEKYEEVDYFMLHVRTTASFLFKLPYVLIFLICNFLIKDSKHKKNETKESHVLDRLLSWNQASLIYMIYLSHNIISACKQSLLSFASSIVTKKKTTVLKYCRFRMLWMLK